MDSGASPDPSFSTDPAPNDLDLPIAIRKGKRACTSHSITNYVSYAHLSPSSDSFVT